MYASSLHIVCVLQFQNNSLVRALWSHGVLSTENDSESSFCLELKGTRIVSKIKDMGVLVLLILGVTLLPSEQSNHYITIIIIIVNTRFNRKV
jgi:hypothetical protein